MIDEWNYLARKYTVEGARSKFEDICTTLFKKKFPNKSVNPVRVVVGDRGVDIFIGNIQNEPVEVIQCKFFINGLGESQKAQIRDSFKTVLASNDFQCCRWILCIPNILGMDEHNWWAGWKNKQVKAHGLAKDFIELMDGSLLINDLKKFNLYDEIFDIEHKKAINEIHNAVVGDKFNLDEEILSASNYMKNLKNHFSKSKEARVQRKEVDEIVTWVKQDLAGKDSLEKVLVVKGKKGVGKSTILREAYCKLLTENEYSVLAIKCDQFYDINLEDLAKQLFKNVLSFQSLIAAVGTEGKKFIVILDQLDALSQTLSSDRRWLQTYIKLIHELLNLSYVRIVISTRSFDLEYDADLRRFNNTQHIRQIEVGTLTKAEVINILKLLTIDVKSDLLIELLTVPYNLELFTKIPNLEGLLQKEVRISLTKLYSELWSQVLTKRELKLTNCLNLIIKRMYRLHPNLIDQTYLEEFQNEIDYLVSQDILLKNGSKLSFFHQSFYEYYLARWFVLSDQDLIEYIFEKGQNLYIRSLIKTVIEYLREADHPKYIALCKNIIGNEKIRFHIKYLFVLELGLIELPSEKEKELVCGMLTNEYGKLFLDLFTSSGWIEFFISNDLLVGNTNEIYIILYRNINHHAKLILDYLENSKFDEKEKFIEGIIPNIKKWENELLPFFDKYYPYKKETELWYFETLKKIAPVNLLFVLEKLRPVISAAQTRTERLRFDHRFDGIIGLLYQQNAKTIVGFLFTIHIEILEDTKHPYYTEYSGIASELLSSYHYDNGMFYKDSEDDKSIDFYLMKYYRGCDRNELKKLVDQYSDTNYVPLLILLIKLLRDRASELIKEIYQLLLIIEAKNGLKESDDFFQLNIRKLISKSIIYFDEQQYQKVKNILLSISHPYEISIYEDGGKKKFSLKIGRKKYLFLKALPFQILQNDTELKQTFQVLERRFGVIDHNKAFDRSKSRFGAVGSPLSNANFDKFNYKAWLKSMRKINEHYKSDDFFKGGLLEHARSFEHVVEKRPDYFCDFIGRLFHEPGVSYSYISHGISALIKANYDSAKVADLVKKEIQLPLDREYTLYATWHTRHLVNTKHVTDDVVDFLISISRSDRYPKDVLNPNNPLSDFINTVRGSAIHTLFCLFSYPKYKDAVFTAIEFAIDPQNNPSTTILTGVMSEIAYLNHLDIARSFSIFQKLVILKNPLILKHSINPAQYFNNKFHDKMGFYFDEMLLHEEFHAECYFFIISWIFEKIDDFKLYDHFIGLGKNAIKCALTVAEKFLIENGNVKNRAMQVLVRCLAHLDFDISHELAGLVLREFKIENFKELYGFIELYISTVHFSNDPRYLLLFLTECSSIYPTECLQLLEKMNILYKVDISKKGYLGDEPLVLVLSIYSRLRLDQFKYINEQQIALDTFDKLLGIPAIRYKALEAMENVLN
ncbi:MAG: hypothetical protein ACRYGB_00380 [Janthinobacterium lividum]